MIKITKIDLALVLAFSAASALAEQPAREGGIPWGPVMVYPAVDVTLKHDDNIFSQASGERTSNIIVVAPKVRLEAKTGPHEFGLSAGFEDGTFTSSRSDNYTDFQVGADASWVFSGRAGLKLRADYNKGHDARGSVVGAGGGPTPDVYHTTGLAGVFGYGSEGAQGRIEVDAGVLNKRYDNNRFLTATTGTRFSDRDETRYGATFFWKVMPKTQLVFQAAEARFDYDDGDYATAGLNVRDSKERRFLVGATWDATYKTTGIFKLGHVKKDFRDSALPDYSGLSWEGIVKWSPLTYSTIDFMTSKKPSEATLGSATVDRTVGLVWNHAWSSRLSSAVSYNNTRSDYQGLAVARRDTVDAFGAKLSYQALRWFKVGAGYDFTNKKSTADAGGYDRNIFSVFVGAAL